MSGGADQTGPVRRNFYGRRHGKTLKLAQREALQVDLPKWRLDGVEQAENPERRTLELSWFAHQSIWLEIGFGSGEHLIHQAVQNPDVLMIGCEPFVNGVASLLLKIRRAGVENVRIHPGDARDLFDVLPRSVLRKVFLLYPDPWPKARHHRRRFVTPEYLLPLARAMAPAADLHIATDIPDYVRQTLEVVPKAGFSWSAEVATDWRCPWRDWPSTRYEAKALREGRNPHYLTFSRIMLAG